MARFLAYSKPRTVPPRVRAAGSHATRRTTASAAAALSTSASERGAQRRECGQDLWSTPPCRPCSPAATGPGSPRRDVPHRHPPRTHRSVSPSQAMCPSPCTRPSRSLASPLRRPQCKARPSTPNREPPPTLVPFLWWAYGHHHNAPCAALRIAFPFPFLHRCAAPSGRHAPPCSNEGVPPIYRSRNPGCLWKIYTLHEAFFPL